MIFFYVLLAVLVLMLMVTIHEAGHYAAGKLLGFGITEFSVGFGPKLLSRKLKSGEEVTLRALPLGGYCAFVGEDDASDADALESAPSGGVAFAAQKPWKRIVVLLAGPLFNLFSAFVFSFIYILAVGYAVPVITNVVSEGGAYVAGLREGDIIVAVDGKDITFLHSAAEAFSDTGTTAILTVERGNERHDIRAEKFTDDNGEYVFGFAAVNEFRSVGVLDAAAYSFPYTFELSWAILRSFGALISGGVSISDVTGPVGTVATIATYVQEDPRYFLLFLPLIASNLAIFNLLPFPALDGARVVFAAIEWIRGKPINKKAETAIHTAGIVILLTAVIVIDIIGMTMRFLS